MPLLRLCLFFITIWFSRSAFAASEECAALVPQLTQSCPAFDYASDRVLDLEVDRPKVTAQQEREPSPSLSATLNRISDAEFDAACCDLIEQLNATRCFCQTDVVDALMSEMSDELLAFALFAAARPIPQGCSGKIWTSLDEGACLLLGPEPDYSDGDEDCRSLEDELRNPKRLNGRFALLEEILDSTGMFGTLNTLRQFVFFAPADTAFQNFAEEQNTTIGELLRDTDLLREVIERHVIIGNSIRDLEEDKAEVETLDGSTVTVRRGRRRRFIVQGFPVVQQDVQICRGTLQVVNGVFWPFSAQNKEPTEDEAAGPSESDCESIHEVLLSSEERFSFLLDRIRLFPDLQEILNGTTGSDNFTLFAPTASEEGVIEVIGEDDSLADVRRGVERLIVTGDIAASELVSGQMLRSISDDLLKVSIENGIVRINNIRVVEPDVTACNGRVHIVAGDLPEAEDDRDRPEDPVLDPEDDDQERRQPAFGTEEDQTEEPSANCNCSEDGLSNSADTGKIGCKQHFIDSRDTSLTCYIQDSGTCEENGEYEIFESERVPGAFWRNCTRDEATLQPIPITLQTIESLEHFHSYIVLSRMMQILSRDDPFTILVPDLAAVDEHNLDSLLTAGAEGAEQIRQLLRKHILPGELKSSTLLIRFNVTSLDGTTLSVSRDASGAVVIDNSVVLTQTDILASNGVIHIVDGIIRPHSIGRNRGRDPCECIEEGDADYEVPDGRRGCQQHIPNEGPFCYVKEPVGCLIGTISLTMPGAKWRVCMNPCRCSETGLSGSVSTGRRGCRRHIGDRPPFCYIADPSRCFQGTDSIGFPGASWKWCDRLGILGAVDNIPSADSCSCSQDGFSGDQYTGRSGCGAFDAPFSFLSFCYVTDPSSCSLALPSLRFEGAAWRPC